MGVSRKNRELIYKRDGGICQVCKSHVEFDLFESGHIIDDSIGGSNTPDNLVVMCQRCNHQKPIHSSIEQYRQWVASKKWNRRVVADLSPDVVNRFWLKVDKSLDCWIWKGATMRTGYSSFYQHGNPYSSIPPHRYSYWLHFGDIPIGYHVRHTCNNRSCVRPDHLSLGTPRDNSDDKIASGRTTRVSGSYNGNSKLNWTQALAIREAKKYDISARRLKEWYGVSLHSIYGIWNGESWSKEPRLLNEDRYKPSSMSKEDEIEYRIMLKVSKDSNGCWNWNGCVKKKDGRPVFATQKLGERSVRRWLWEHYIDNIPKGKAVINVCENNLCVNPDHHIVDSPIKAMHWMRDGYESGEFVRPINKENS